MGCSVRTQGTAKKSKTVFSSLTVSRFVVKIKQIAMAVSLGIIIFSVKEKITGIKSKKLNKSPINLKLEM